MTADIHVASEMNYYLFISRLVYLFSLQTKIYKLTFFLQNNPIVAAVLMMTLDDGMTAEFAIRKLRQLKGPGAIQTVKVCCVCH